MGLGINSSNGTNRASRYGKSGRQASGDVVCRDGQHWSGTPTGTQTVIDLIHPVVCVNRGPGCPTPSAPATRHSFGPGGCAGYLTDPSATSIRSPLRIWVHAGYATFLLGAELVIGLGSDNASRLAQQNVELTGGRSAHPVHVNHCDGKIRVSWTLSSQDAERRVTRTDCVVYVRVGDYISWDHAPCPQQLPDYSGIELGRELCSELCCSRRQP